MSTCGSAQCENLPGSYSCMCDPGYTYNSQEKACLGTPCPAPQLLRLLPASHVHKGWPPGSQNDRQMKSGTRRNPRLHLPLATHCDTQHICIHVQACTRSHIHMHPAHMCTCMMGMMAHMCLPQPPIGMKEPLPSSWDPGSSPT